MFCAVLPAVYEWFERAKAGSITVYNFPPMRRPARGQIAKLVKGSTCLLFVYDERKLAGEFKVVSVKRVSYENFQALNDRAFEVVEAKFPSLGEWCWIIEFTDFRAYDRPLSEDEFRKVLGEMYGKRASNRPLQWTQIVDEKLVDAIKLINLLIDFLGKR